MILDFRLLLFIAPALILGFIAQIMVKVDVRQIKTNRARMSGYAAARQVLDGSGLYDVEIEQVPGRLSDHYDPRHKVLRLSSDVYHGRNMSAVGIAAHEAGHALQDAQHYAPLVVRNAAVPAANFGSSAGLLLAALGMFLGMQPLLLIGIVVFSGVVFFQVVNLPVEFNASNRAKRQLIDLGIIDQQQLPYVRRC